MTIEEAESRLERLVEVKALFLGLTIGVVASFIVGLAVPLQVRVEQGLVTLSLGERSFGPVRSQDYYVALFVTAIVFLAIAVWKVKQVYGLTEKIDTSFDHSKDRAQLAQELGEPLRGLGRVYGYSMKQELAPKGNDLLIDFLPESSEDWVLRVQVGEKQVRLHAAIDRGAIAFAKDVRARILAVLAIG